MFKEKDIVLLVDTKGRKYICQLVPNGIFFFHKGQVNHNDIIGKPEGCIIYSSLNEKLLVLKPTLMEFLLYGLNRKGQIIYPKDIGQILVLLDVYPGAKVFECGCGSGAMTLCLLRAVGETGKVVSVDIREDMISTAKENIEWYYGKPINEIVNLELRHMDFKQTIPEGQYDRVVIDILDPWEVVGNVEKILLSSGIAGFWLPTVLQVFNLVDTVEKNFSKSFVLQGIYEILQREWEKNQLSLRPKHRMVAHTGFLIVYRKIVP